ncbi:PAS domain-containing protein [Aequorivita lipolytica]|uniref:PAS domain-containing protein n=1 Tax=Aequorivita lipolytica TaxID=153267 RepID=A0A5C6YLJ0_9FLAO|nr:PAS domain-containing protein [Aequorivita lipolytica]TXD68209.1 PAS domain-containing protein [Aequorivita lipolytica]SRX53513.1 Blue-light photoreceptor [Aequorivita lipolytica]
MANYNLWDMAGLDVFLQSLSEQQREKYFNIIEPQTYLSPLKSWGLSAEFFKPTALLETRQKDRASLTLLANQFHWKANLSEILTKSYDALIVTDFSQKIVWANNGFFKMTGYSESYAIGKTPSFLQGNETSTQVKASIREKLQRGEPFTEEVLNYKKDQREYWCKIQIFPLLSAGLTTHYLALETELL